MIILSSCQRTPSIVNTNDSISTSEESVNNDTLQSEALSIAENGDIEFIQAIQIADGIFDIGSTLFPDPEAFVSARVLSSGRLLVWTMNVSNESVIYDYTTGEIVHRFSPAIIRLGMEHYFSQQQNGENSYTITLYDNDLNILAQHRTDRPAIPATDGVTILYGERPPTMRNVHTNEKTEIAISDIAPEYEGGIFTWAFDGEWMFFRATANPFLGNEGIGAYNVLTEQSVFSDDFPEMFAGLPETFGRSSAIFWQDGSAFGTDGTYSVIVDALNSDIRIIDVGITANHMSDNGNILVAVDAVGIAWEEDIFDFPVQNTTLSQIIIYDAHSLEPISSRNFEPLIGVMAGSFGGGISVSEDGRYVFLRGFVYDGGSRRQSLFMIEMEL